MTSIQRIAASLAVSIGLTLLATIGAEAAPVNATAQKNLGPVSEAASNQLELIGRGGGKGGGREFHRDGGGRSWGDRGGGRRSGHGDGGRKWGHDDHGGRKGRDHHRHRHHFDGGAPFLFGYYDYDYGYDDGYGSCYRECRAFNGPRYCRRYWRSYC